MRKCYLAFVLLLISQFSFASLPYFPLSFPRDEGAHYKNVPYAFNQLIEWWYLNGRLKTDEGRNLTYDIALFNAAAMGGMITQPMLHIQLADLDRKQTYGVANNYPYNTGKLATDKLDIVIEDDYSLKKTTINGREVYILKAQSQNENTFLKLDLTLEPVARPFLINQNGLMPMPNDTNSYYYSIAHFNTTGTVTINNATYQIRMQKGDSWMDHQWGDFNVQKNGWEWFSIRLENGLVANVFLNIEYKNHMVVSGLANIILPSGEMRFIPYKDFSVTRDDYWFDPKLSIAFPMTFTFDFPKLGLKIRNAAVFPEQELHGYWEGYCKVEAVYNKQDVSGFSYTELVYDNPSANKPGRHLVG
ncbi:hypothetical protein AQUSIP_14190 [Aquicella siphonis]|uniref:AttH domain-containing protein n=1 Tax=Aquicella siphonis TaxID=254247 RepID=A0A5E4PGV5_9COXI|nr:lipocalin-like domain-containing protein [Aquicella siphonis]VVC76114.1 hypothetical protein AQUSIP_14190 [Aquicella siphonis]